MFIRDEGGSAFPIGDAASGGALAGGGGAMGRAIPDVGNRRDFSSGAGNAALNVPGATLPTPTAASAPAAPGVPGFGNPQDLMRQIIQMILVPQLARFFGGGTGLPSFNGFAGYPNPSPFGEVTASVNQGLGAAPNPMQQVQGPAGSQSGLFSFLAPFLFQRFFSNMGSSWSPTGGATSNPSPYGL